MVLLSSFLLQALVDYSIILLLHDIPDSGYSDVVVSSSLLPCHVFLPVVYKLSNQPYCSSYKEYGDGGTRKNLSELLQVWDPHVWQLYLGN